jgi:hypothetical protein
MFLEKRGLKFDSCKISATKQIWKGVCGRQGKYHQVQKCSFEKKTVLPSVNYTERPEMW